MPKYIFGNFRFPSTGPCDLTHIVTQRIKTFCVVILPLCGEAHEEFVAIVLGEGNAVYCQHLSQLLVEKHWKYTILLL